MSELKNERGRLSDFLKLKLRASIVVKGKILVVGSEERLSPKDVKTCVKRFLYHRGLSENYRVIKEHETIRITKRRLSKKKRVKKKGIPPSSYDTLPYLFPTHP